MPRSLLIAPQWIGDAVMSERLVALLAARGEQITVAALPWVAPVYRAMPSVTEVIDLPFSHGRLDWSSRRRVAAGLRGRFDRAYVAPNSIKSALIPWLARIPLRIGYQGEGRPLLLTRRLPNPAGRPPMVAFYAALADVPNPPDERPRLSLPDAAIGSAAQAAGVTRGAYWVFAPGAEYGPAKCWPASHYAALARTLQAREGLPILLLGAGKEAALCEQIATAATGACQVLAGKTPLLDAMALIAGARGVVSNDSGLMHVAAAFGVPQAAVFGSTSPEHTPPLSPHARVLWLKEELSLDCAPCCDRVCRFGHTRCLTEVSPARVDHALAEALASVRSPRPCYCCAMASDLPSSPPPPASASPVRDKEHEALMRAALLGAGTSVWEWNVLEDTLDDGEGSNALLGYAPGEVAKRQADWNRLIHPDDLADNHAQYERHARGETPAYESEYRARTKDGRWRWICERGRIVERTPDGRPSRMVGTLNDVSERRAAEARAHEATERLQKIARHVPGILFQFRRSTPTDGRFPYISESSEEVVGLGCEVLMSDAGALLSMTERDDRDRLRRSIEESARTVEPWACEFRLHRLDGSVRWVTGTATPQCEPDGSLLWHGYLAETTRLREFDQARQAAAAAQTANQAMTEFLSHMSHELRTPLNVVLGFAQLMLADARDPLSAGQHQRVGLIKGAGDHLLEMIGQLLDLTRIESGNLVLDPSEFAPWPLVRECAEMLQPLAAAAGVSLAVDSADPGGATHSVRADRTRLRQVLLNLIGNAIKYNRRGGSVRLSLQLEAGDGMPQWRVSVADTGVGIAAEELERIGQAFHRGAHQRSGIEGSGIGLAITRGLVEAMDGQLDVTSTPGVGSTFSVCLPARR